MASLPLLFSPFFSLKECIPVCGLLFFRRQKGRPKRKGHWRDASRPKWARPRWTQNCVCGQTLKNPRGKVAARKRGRATFFFETKRGNWSLLFFSCHFFANLLRAREKALQGTRANTSLVCCGRRRRMASVSCCPFTNDCALRNHRFVIRMVYLNKKREKRHF